MRLLKNSAQDVIDGLKIADELIPFVFQGLETDCGSEFINYDLLDYCEDNNITFTRARTHRKNDQAHDIVGSTSRKGDCWDIETIFSFTGDNDLIRAGIDLVSLCCPVGHYLPVINPFQNL